MDKGVRTPKELRKLPFRTDQLGSRLLESDSTLCDESALIPAAKKSDLKERNDTTRVATQSIAMLEDHSDNTTGSGFVNPTIGLAKSEERGHVSALSQISSQSELANSSTSQSLKKGSLRKGNQCITGIKRSYDEITGLSKPHPIAQVLTFNSFLSDLETGIGGLLSNDITPDSYT